MRNIAFILICFYSSFFLYAQEKEVLFTIDDQPFYTDEFVRVYNKNLDLVKDDSQKDLDKYLDLFLGYKLKVQKANKLGLQNDSKYINELNSYRTQLAKNYLNDSKVTNGLIEEAYQRIKNEVRASHILVLVDESATPQDTLKAYNAIMNLKARAEGSEGFDAIAAKYSEDPSAKENKGDLGYFTAFKMVYPFENAAFSIPVGSISKPFRTRFGYHIIKVTDKRENRGEITVAHIMILKPNNKTTAEEQKAKQTITDIYQKIQQGENFETLAKQFSEDKSSAVNGGVLQRFGSGQLTSQEFEDVAFSLKDKNQISTPFESKFGWHIIKLIEKHPVQSLDEMRYDLENKIRRDERSLIITNSLAKKARAKYPIKVDDKMVSKIKSWITDDFYTQSWSIPEKANEVDETLVTINNDSKIATKEFLNYLVSQQKGAVKVKPTSKLVDQLLENWLDDKLIAYYDANLENEFPEFKYVMDEYRDGLLLFDLMEKEIWIKAKTDTVGLEGFYQNHKKDYMWKKRVDVDLLSSTDAKIIKKAQSYLKSGKSIEYIKEKLNKEGQVNIMVKSGVFEEDFDVLPEFKIEKKGVTPIVSKGEYYFTALVKEVKSAEPKALSECKGKLINDYQQYLESNWVSELKMEFNVKVDETVFAKIKNQLKK
ncbi:peptidylprolyl isomerase [Flavobacterium sp. NRK F7]|uniref:peptidylprolyl isomerase n=1 Tax=Flavobacterium sp. NRK F7 TaxID=2954930 RepID=UPI0020912CC6|nr:peptidylprolyl isomerase [Flavobacterium sp. NRK F7]MCO6164100.1 peptidyl-prolyl cis-trans isomerase [Flavobacterium sp. NRK F7]